MRVLKTICFLVSQSVCVCVWRGGRLFTIPAQDQCQGFTISPFCLPLSFMRDYEIFTSSFSLPQSLICLTKGKKRRGQSGNLLGSTGHTVLDCRYHHSSFIACSPHPGASNFNKHWNHRGPAAQTGWIQKVQVGSEIRCLQSSRVMPMLLVCVAAYHMVPCEQSYT